MKLPKLKTHPAPEWQKERLARWLAEWEIDKSLLDEKVHGAAGSPRRHSDSANGNVGAVYPNGDQLRDVTAPLGEEPAVKTGQIRLLSPEIPGAEIRPVYLAVLREAGPDRFIAAPYSRFAEPASEGELLTGRDVPCLRVLCLWNAQTFSSDILNKSWMLDDLSGDEINKALAVLRHMTEKGDLPPDLEKRVGPPISHPADPRQIYQEEEIELMESILESRGNTLLPFRYETEEKRELPLAAEPRDSYDTEKNHKKKK